MAEVELWVHRLMAQGENPNVLLLLVHLFFHLTEPSFHFIKLRVMIIVLDVHSLLLNMLTGQPLKQIDLKRLIKCVTRLFYHIEYVQINRHVFECKLHQATITVDQCIRCC